MSGWTESCGIGIAATRPGLFRSAARCWCWRGVGVAWWPFWTWGDERTGADACKPTQDFTASESASLQHGCGLTDELNEQTHPCFPSWYAEAGWSRWRSFCWALGNGYLPVFAQGFGVSYKHQGCFSSQALLLQTVVLCVLVKRTPSRVLTALLLRAKWAVRCHCVSTTTRGGNWCVILLSGKPDLDSNPWVFTTLCCAFTRVVNCSGRASLRFCR